MHERLVVGLVDRVSRNPWATLGAALVVMIALGGYAARLELRSDLLELLPRDSPGFRAFEHQLGRVGGGSTLLVIAASPERAKNEAFIDDLGARLDAFAESASPTGRLIGYVEHDTKPVRAFYQANRWLYASLTDLREADRELDRQIALRSGLVEDLDDGAARPAPALGMRAYSDRWEDAVRARDAFPAGYFENHDGTLVGLRIVANTALGDARGDVLLGEVEHLVRELEPARYQAAMRVGFTGDLAGAADEKRAIAQEALGATALALGVVVVAIGLFFRSALAVAVVGLPALFGTVVAYAFAQLAFGYLNTAGAFLGAIILGNGINYPIVLYARYQEFRARGIDPAAARRAAVLDAFRAELVGACVAAIAYGSLMLTRFRGYSQFGAIGFVGMLVAWASIVPLVPAAIVVSERLGAVISRLGPDGSRPLARLAAALVRRRPGAVLIVAMILTAFAAARIPAYLADPWEYDFGKLGSRRTEVTGAGEWSNKANEVFGGKMNVAGALMLADRADQVARVKAQILANDALDPAGPMIAEITTVDDLLPGGAQEQEAKLEILARIRERLSERVLGDLDGDERRTLDEMRPPESLRILSAPDLPAALRRRFTENDGRLGTVFYVKPRNEVVFADGRNHLRLSRTTDNVRLDDGTVVMTASRSTLFAEMLRSLRRDSPLAAAAASLAVAAVIVVAARNRRLAGAVLLSLALGLTWLLGWAAYAGVRIHYVDFIAVPITLGIGCEYPFNIADRIRRLGDVVAAVSRSGGAVALCSFTTMVGYASLLIADVQALQAFGKLAVAGELACVVTALVVLPSGLLVAAKFDRTRWRQPTAQ